MSKALILVDVQQDFCEGGALAVHGADAIVDQLNDLSAAFFLANQPVFACRDWHPTNHKSFKAQGGPYPVHCIQNTPGADLHPRLKHAGVTIVDKAYRADDLDMSAFADGRLKEMLELSGVKAVYIAGISTEFGIRVTALDALKAGFATYLIQEAVVPAKPQAGDKAIADLVRAGVHFVNVQEAIESLPKATIV